MNEDILLASNIMMNPSGQAAAAAAAASSMWHQTNDLNLNNPPIMANTANVVDQANISSASFMSNHQSPFNKSLNMETESVMSGFSSDRSKKGRNGTAAYATVLNNTTNLSMLANPAAVVASASTTSPLMANNVVINPYHGNYQANNNSGHHHQVHSVVSMRSRNSHQSTNRLNLNGQIPSKALDSPYAITTATTTNNNLNHNSNNNQRPQDMIQVSMLSPDDNWNDNTTAITGNTSDQSGGSMDDLTKLDKAQLMDDHFQIRCQLWSASVMAIVLSVCAFCSPIIMVILPRIDILEWRTKECGPECDGLVISFVFKLLILAVGSWAVFFRRPKATMPRICVYRSAVLALIVIFMVAYWLFYSVRIAEKRFSEEDAISYYSILLFAISLVDALLFIHYLAVLLLEFRHLDTQYFIKVVRSPDGHSQCYSLGKTSIQRASVWILEKYYQDFPRYNPFLERVALIKKSRKNSTTSRQSGLKYYDVDGVIGSPNNNHHKKDHENNNPLQLSPKSILAQNTAANAGRPKGAYLNGGHTITDGRNGGGGGGGSRTRNIDRGDTASHHSGHSGHHGHHRHHSDRFHEEHEYERRVRKRKSRLISVTEEAFTHIKRVQQTRNGPSVPMNPKEAAQAIFPTIAKTLQKYLRITRQQTRHSVQSILEHLAICLTYDLSPKTFLERYFSTTPMLAGEDGRKPLQTWSLICDTLVSRSIKSGTMFILRQGDVCLLVTVHQIPHLNLREEVVDVDNTKFIFKLNSETSV